MLMALGFAGVLLSSLVNFSDARRLRLVVLFATALLCPGFAALLGWFAVSGATNSWF
jgi:hypothetical protein